MMSKKLKSNFSVLKKHAAFYTGGDIQMSKSGKYIFCTCGDKVNIVEVDSGTVFKAIEQGEGDAVTSFRLSCDDKVLITAGQSGLLKQWDWETDTCTRTWKAMQMGTINHVTIDSTVTLVATASTDSTVKVWDIIRQYCTHNLKGAQGVISALEFHPDTTRLLLFGSGTDNVINVWHLVKSEMTTKLTGHYGAVTSFSFSDDGDMMLSSGRDQAVILWDLKEFKAMKTILVFEIVESACLLPENFKFPALGVKKKGLYFITAGEKGSLVLWNAWTGLPAHSESKTIIASDSPVPEGSSLITSLSVNLDQKVLMMSTFEHTVLIHNLADFQLKKQFTGYNDDILDVEFIGQTNSHLAVATNSANIKLFDVAAFNCQLLQGHRNTVIALQAFSTNRNLFASSSKDMTVRVWLMNQDTGVTSCVAMGEGHTHTVTAVACSRMSARFLVTVSEDQCLKVWDVPKSAHSSVPEFPRVLKMQEKVLAHEKVVTSAAVSPNDRLIVTGSRDKTAKVWGVDCNLLGVLKGHNRVVWSVDFSPVDQVVTTSSGDGTIKIWSLSDFSCLKTFEGHDSSVVKVKFLSRGMQLLSSGSDGLLKLWTIKLNVCIKTFDEHSDKVWAMATSNSEDRLATGGADSSIIIWKDVTEEEQEEERKKKETFVLQEQELLNLLQQKRFAKALGLAIVLDQPFRALNIIKQMVLEPNGTADLAVTLHKMRDDQIDSLIKFATTWNMNGRHSWPAQLVLKHVLERYTVDELLQIPNMRNNVHALIPYTERHFQRLTRALQQATFVDYTWCCMKLASKVKLTDDEDAQTNDKLAHPDVAPSTAESLWDLGGDSDEDIVLQVRKNVEGGGGGAHTGADLSEEEGDSSSE